MLLYYAHSVMQMQQPAALLLQYHTGWCMHMGEMVAAWAGPCPHADALSLVPLPDTLSRVADKAADIAGQLATWCHSLYS